MARIRWITTGFEVAMVVFVAVLLLHRFVPMRAAEPSPANAVTFTLTGLDGNRLDPAHARITWSGVRHLPDAALHIGDQ